MKFYSWPMITTHIIGPDYDMESACGVLLEAATAEQIASHTHAYPMA